MLEIKNSPGGSRVIPKWAEQRLARRLEEPEGFKSYGEVQQWRLDHVGSGSGVSCGVSDDTLSPQSQTQSASSAK